MQTMSEASVSLHSLKNAVDFLAGRCDWASTLDGVGFNKFDADLGHNLAGLPEESWTPKQKWAAWKMLVKYRGQLASVGIDYKEIPVPPDPYKAPPQEPVSERDWKTFVEQAKAGLAEAGQHPSPEIQSQRIIIWSEETELFRIKFPYDGNLVRAVKDIPGRRWVADKKFWTVPRAVGSAPRLLEFGEKYKFHMPNEVIQILKSVTTLSDVLHTMSDAEESEFTVTGIRGELLPFQKAGVEYSLKAMTVGSGTIIGDDMGLGKTMEALAILWHLQAFPAVIFCPSSVKINWTYEARKWLGVSSYIFNGRTSVPVDEIRGFDLYVLNYDIARDHEETLLALNLEAAIMDECHKLKNSKAQRSQTVKKVAHTTKVRLALSGTLIINRPIELWNTLVIIGREKDISPGGWKAFVNEFCGWKYNGFGVDTSGARNTQELNRRLRAACYVRRLKEDVTPELPPLRNSVIPVELDNYSEYQKAEDDIIAWIGEQAVQDQDFLDSIADLEQDQQEILIRDRRGGKEAAAERAEQLVRIEALKQLAAKGKISTILDWIKDFLETSDEKLIVFAHHVNIQRQLLAKLVKDGEKKGYKVVSITGSQTAVERQQQKDAFQDDSEVRVIVASLKAGGEGITLTAASKAVFTELGWTPAEHDQAADRMVRIGQTADNLTAYYFVGLYTIEEEIATLLDEKRKVVTGVLDGEEMEVDKSIMQGVLDYLARKGGLYENET